MLLLRIGFFLGSKVMCISSLGTRGIIRTPLSIQPYLTFHPAICTNGFKYKPCLGEQTFLHCLLTELEWRPEAAAAIVILGDAGTIARCFIKY